MPSINPNLKLNKASEFALKGRDFYHNFYDTFIVNPKLAEKLVLEMYDDDRKFLHSFIDLLTFDHLRIDFEKHLENYESKVNNEPELVKHNESFLIYIEKFDKLIFKRLMHILGFRLADDDEKKGIQNLKEIEYVRLAFTIVYMLTKDSDIQYDIFNKN